MATKKLGIGVIGTGGIARSAHLPGYAAVPDLCQIVAMADIDPEALQRAASEFGVKNTFEDYRKLLEMDEVDAVSVCTPNYAHMEPAIKAFEAGKHVLCEKPIALNAKQAREMVATAKKAGKKFQVGYNLRFSPQHQLLKRYVESGDFGDIYYGRAQALRRRGIPGWGVFIDKAKQGGGPLIDIGVHVLDLTLWLMGHPKPLKASGVTYAKLGTRGDLVGFLGQWDYKNFTVEDFASALIRFDNGATVVLESSFAANLPEDIFATTILGTEGGAVSDPLTIIQERHRAVHKFHPELPSSANKLNTHHEEIRRFVECILDDIEPYVTGEQALMVAEIMDAIYASSESGAEVAVG